MGWCPMAASAQKESPGHATKVLREKADNTGPVAGRAVLFSRLTWIVVGLSYLIALAALSHLPETIPVHWNLYGEADAFAGSYFGAFVFPVIITLLAVFLVLQPRFERFKGSLDETRDIYAIVIFSTVSVLLGLEIMTLLSSMGMELPLAMILAMLFGFFFIVLGCLTPSIGRNTTIGIRLPWTIRDERVWTKTHERGGTVMILAGVLIVLGSPVAGVWAITLMAGIIVAVVLYITLYSYFLAKRGTPGE
jgi:uncharacterized membrane protein